MKRLAWSLEIGEFWRMGSDMAHGPHRRPWTTTYAGASWPMGGAAWRWPS